jgi:hypothetical protein
MFRRQLKHAPASAIPWPSPGKSPLNTSRNNGEILGSGVFYAVRAEAVYRGRKRKVETTNFSSEGMLHKEYDCKGSVKKENPLAMSLKRLGANTN